MPDANGEVRSARGFDPERLPPELRIDLPRFLRWHLAENEKGKLTKRPDCSTRDLRALRTLREVLAVGPLDATQGIGFCFFGGVEVPRGRLYALDLDACRSPDTGAVASWALRVWEHYGRTWTEITPSGTGLRVWIIVRNPPRRMRRAKVRVDAERPPGVPDSKTVELQVFGYGAAQYVTMTGNVLPGSSDTIVAVANLEWLETEFGIGSDDDDETVSELPAGAGAPPSLEAVEAAVRAAPGGEDFVEGRWPAMLDGSPGDRSASAAFYRGAQIVLRAARNHGATALGFLIGATAWGRGEIHDSADPSKYARPSWVAAELRRVAEKARPPSVEVFSALPVLKEAAALEAPERSRGSALIHVSDLIEGIDRDPFLVHGVLPARGLAEFFGEPGSGKTPFAMSLNVHVAAGMGAWFDHEIDRPGPTVYFAGEDFAGVSARAKAELEALGLDPAKVPLYVSERPGRFTDTADVAFWYGEILARCGDEKPALVTLDTMSRNWGGGNESKTEDMQTFIDNASELQRRLGCLVLALHHPGHAEKERSRGSSVLLGALDSSYQITRKDRSMRVTARCRKMKNSGDPEPLVGRLIVETVGEDSKGRPLTAVRLAPGAGDVEAAFAELSDDGEPVRRVVRAIAELEGGKTPREELARRSGITKGRPLETALERAAELGLIDPETRKKGRGGTVWRVTAAGRDVCGSGETPGKIVAELLG